MSNTGWNSKWANRPIKTAKISDGKGKLGRLGLCVFQTKNSMQHWVQHLVYNKFLMQRWFQL
jgi:hypothetical protein